MKSNTKDFFYIGRRYKKEFKKQMRMLIIITLGFTIAFTWRQTIFDLSESFVNFFLHLKNNSVSSILTSVFITLLSLILIIITTYWLKDNPQDKY